MSELHTIEEPKTKEQPVLSEELKKMEYEPLLPIEKKLISWSIGLGVILLIVLYFISRLLPSAHN